MIAPAWLQMFGVLEGMRIVSMRRPHRSYRVGLVVTERQPESMMGRAPVDVAAEPDLRRGPRRHRPPSFSGVAGRQFCRSGPPAAEVMLAAPRPFPASVDSLAPPPERHL